MRYLNDEGLLQAATDFYGKINNETTARTNADKTLQTAINNEITNRKTADAETLTAAKTYADNGLASKSATNHTHAAATASAAGMMSSADKTKLDGVATGATKVIVDNALSATSANPLQNKAVNAAIVSETTARTNADSALQTAINSEITNRKTADAETLTAAKTYADNGLAGKSATNHTHTAATTSAAGFMSAADKAKIDGIATGANKTTVDTALSTTSTNPVQNKVINTALAGKSATNHTHAVATTSADGMMSAADKTKLGGIATGATKTTADGKTINNSNGVLTANYIGENLLINGNFENPVNQRGQSSYSGYVYGLDCWRCGESTSLKINDSGIVISYTGTATNKTRLSQKIEDYKSLSGKIVTFSFAFNALSGGIILAINNSVSSIYSNTFSADGVAVLTAEIPKESTSLQVAVIGTSPQTVFTPLWAKLELGSAATPFVPPNPAVELAKCQRYFMRIDHVTLDCKAKANPRLIFVADNYLCYLYNNMAKTPTITITGNVNDEKGIAIKDKIANATVGVINYCTISKYTDSFNINAFMTTYPTQTIDTIYIRICDDAYIDLSAEL